MNENNCCCSSSKCCTTATIQTVSTQLTFKDMLGGWKVRWGIGRMNYKIDAGLYAIGTPNQASPILVSANYKLTFDLLRKELEGVNCWLLILDTKGVNVWCAAGKGTFSTVELLNRISLTNLTEVTSQRTLILPQLGASGINASEVKQKSGFSVVYGTVRANDIKAFLEADNKATEEMRTVKFTMRDRLVLTPMEIVPTVPKAFIGFGILFLINLFATKPFGLIDVIAFVGAILIGTFVTPILLPFVPSHAFSFKGGIAMNFTGSSTYTSPSGVLKEMKIALPIIIVSSLVGAILVLLNRIWGI
jgi:CO dehydrogenase/acetyl-CoA synthase gamma subunit (corrinoid Fe-S protein)